jgi:hypothetical protein
MQALPDGRSRMFQFGSFEILSKGRSSQMESSALWKNCAKDFWGKAGSSPGLAARFGMTSGTGGSY